MVMYNRYGYRVRRKKKSCTPAKTPTEHSVAKILSQFQEINAKKILEEFARAPDTFNFKSATPAQLDSLLTYDFELFAPHLDVNSLAVYERVRWLNTQNNASNYIDVNKLPNYAIDDMVTKKPAIVEILPISFSKIAYGGWQALINYDKAYMLRLVKNLHNMRNKTELRRLMVANPDIFPMLTVEAIQGSVITAKEWALMLKWPALKNVKVNFSPEVTEWLDQEILTEILLGNSNSSKQLNAALSILRG